MVKLMIKFSKKAREKINKKLPTLGEKFDSQKREHQVFVTALVGYVFFLFFIVYSSIMNVPSFANNTNLNVEKPETVKFASDEVLIKIRKSSVSRIREDSANVGVDSLNSLNKEFKIKKMEKVAKSKKIASDSEISQWYVVKFNEPREEINSTQSEVNTQLINDLINDDKFFSRLAKYKKDANIERVEPNYVVNTFQTATPSSSPSPIISINPNSTPSSTPIPSVTPLP